MRRLMLLALLLTGTTAVAQTTVTATVVDSDGTAWANGTYTVRYQPSPGFSGVLVNTLTGAPLSQTVNGTLDSTGSFSVNLVPSVFVKAANGIIPGVVFTVCPQMGSPCYPTSIVSIGTSPSTQSVSSKINAAISLAPLRFTADAAGTVKAYNDAEVTGAGGTRYFRLSDNSFRCFTTAWGSCGGTSIAGAATARGTGFFQNQQVYVFGDSITATGCVGVSQANCWTSLPEFTNGFTAVTNFAVSGDQAADQVYNKIYGNLDPHYYQERQSIIMIGTNDANICVVTNGGGAGCYANYFHTLLSGAAWASIPQENKIIPQLAVSNAQCAITGTWTNATFQVNLAAIQTIVPTSTITCTTLDASATGLYINWKATDGLTASASLTIDGVATDTLNAFGFNSQTIATFNGLTSTAFGARYAIAAGTTHTFKITVNSAGSGNAFTFLWAGSPTPINPTDLSSQNQNPPSIAIGSVPYQQNNANATATATMDAQAQNVSATLIGDGAFAPYVNVRSYLNSTNDFTSTSFTAPNGLSYCGSSLTPLHPNCLGQQHIADAFIKTLLPIASTWNFNNWLTTTPTPACGSGSGTLNSVVNMEKVGKTAFINMAVGISSIGTCGTDITVTMPFVASSTQSISCVETAIVGYSYVGHILSGTSTLYIARWDNTMSGTQNGWVASCNGIFQTQ